MREVALSDRWQNGPPASPMGRRRAETPPPQGRWRREPPAKSPPEKGRASVLPNGPRDQALLVCGAATGEGTPMALHATLEDVLQQVRTRIAKLSGSPVGEANTRAALIEPVLRALGWDTEDLNEVHREFKPQATDNPVDYALLLSGVPSLFVEAKALGSDLSDRKWASQMMGYATVAGVTWVVLTNGAEYRIYNAHAAVPVEDKLLRAARVTDDTQAVVETLRLISKESLRRGLIVACWERYFVDRRVVAALQELFCHEPDASLVRLLAKRLPTLSASDVRAALRRIKPVFAMGEQPDLAIGPGTGENGRSPDASPPPIPVSEYVRFITEYLRAQPDRTARLPDIQQTVRTNLPLGPRDLEPDSPRLGTGPRWRHKVGGALYHMRVRGKAERVGPGLWRLTGE